MATFHSQYFRGEIATPDKVTGNSDFPADIVSKKYKAAHESGDPHEGAIVGTIQYDGSEFHVRVFVGGRDWCFRALSIEALRDQIHRFFPGDRQRIRLTLSQRADLARFGEHAAIGRL